MHAVGARARVSAAQCLSRQPSSELAHLSTKLRHPDGVVLSLLRYPSRRHGSTSPSGAKEDGSVPGKPTESEIEADGKDKGKEAQSTDDPETAGKPHEASKQPLFSSFGRLRPNNHNTSRSTGAGFPPVELPQWFRDEDVVCFDAEKAFRERVQRCIQRIAAGPFDPREVNKEPSSDSSKPEEKLTPDAEDRPDASKEPMQEGEVQSDSQGEPDYSDTSLDRTLLQRQIEKLLNEAAWSEQLVKDAEQAIAAGDYITPSFRAQSFGSLAGLYAESLYHKEVHAPNMQRRFATIFETYGIKDNWRHNMNWDKILERQDSSREFCRELLSTVSAELSAIPPPSRPTRVLRQRPVTVLSIANYKGSRVINDIVDDLGVDLQADVIHLDAAKLARIVGPYIGQTTYYGRGDVAMLGYQAAEANQRTPSTASTSPIIIKVSEEGGTESETISITKASASAPDDSWEAMKINHILLEIIRAAGDRTRGKSKRLILHIHDYVELMLTPAGTDIINKLRAIVDRLWYKGRSIVMLGSSSTNVQAGISYDWLKKLRQISEEDSYVIHHQLTKDKATELEELQKKDFVQDNLRNLSWMLESFVAKPVRVVLPDVPSDLEADQELRELIEGLSNIIHPVDWVYRFATQILGLRRYHAHNFDMLTIVEAFNQMKQLDDINLSPTGHSGSQIGPSFTSMLGVPFENLSNLFQLTKALRDTLPADRQKSLVEGKDLDDDEKKLLSGLVNVEDIKTTFDDVVAPPEIRESLMGLTTLSLQHPTAFSYGVLARERIHGCLLYGPPGTGKTLMAKAVAKESGANMLEISAASINDMWVGASEKNVRAVFSLARKMSPMVVFLDEAEALLGSRGKQPARGGSKETINQFLREWDGLTNSLNDSKTFIMVATNRPFDLDEAVLRRLPRRILVDLPLRDARLAIFQSLMKDEVLDDSVSLERLATDTELYSGSDIKNMCVAAAMEAAKEELREKTNHIGPEEFKFKAKRVLTNVHFDKALKDISASISEDMESLKAIRKFDERYGDARKKKKKGNMGFEIVASKMATSEQARVRQA